MKKNYVFLILVLVSFIPLTNAQTVPADINFFTTEGYTNNSELNNNANWQTKATWNNQLFCSDTYGYQRYTANWARSQWQTPIQATANQIISLRLDFDPSSGTVANSTSLLNFGLISASGIPDLNSNNSLATYIKTDATGNYTIDSTGDGSTACVIGERTYIVVEVSVGADAASSIFSAQLFNDDDDAISGTRTTTGIPADLYTAITGTGAYAVFSAQNFKTSGGFQRIDISRMKVSVANAQSSATYDGTSWDSGSPIGTTDTSKDVIITSGNVAFSGTSSFKSLTINAGASVTLPTGNSITTVDGTVLDAGASLIAEGTSTVTGDVTYNRTIDYVGALSAGYPADSEIKWPWAASGTDFTFPVKNVASGGAASSNWFVRMERGGTASFAYIERIYPLTAGATYEFKASVFPDAAGQKNAYTLRVMDVATEVAESATPATGSTWQELSISYTAAETKNYKFRVQKTWGNQGASIDNYSIVCTSCDPQETVYSDDFEAVYVNDNLKGWYLMASPVAHSNFSVDTFTTNNDIATSNSDVAIATYGTSDDSWSYFEAGTTRNFLPGKGYSIKKASTTGTVPFTGTLHTEDAGVDIALSSEGNRYNLLGNPYTSYINSATFLANAALSETQTIWVYDQTLSTNGSYVVKTLDEDFILAPGQGFFVRANAAGGSVNFAETNQSHTSDTFQKTSKTEVKIQLSVNGAIQYAKLYYLNTATTGFDVGYEGEVFGGTTNEFSIYTHLLTDNVGKKYQVQSLPNSEYESMVIPVGVKAAANKEIIISAEALNLPEDVNVFLEDKQTNTFTRLDEANSNYKITLTEDLDGIGRFYLHTTSSVLNTDKVAINNNISIYTSSKDLHIIGVQNGITKVSLYNILGKQILHTSFKGNGVNTIPLPNFNSGVYIVQLETETRIVNKKIILE